jgi:hypothetical protein
LREQVRADGVETQAESRIRPGIRTNRALARIFHVLGSHIVSEVTASGLRSPYRSRCSSGLVPPLLIMTEKDDKLPADIPPPAGENRDRRRSHQRDDAAAPKPGAVGSVEHDDLGNAVWNWRVDVPRRREDDPTIDLLECLDVEGLSLEEDEPETEDDGFEPYGGKR